MSESSIDWSCIILDNLFRLYRATEGNNNVKHIVNDGYEIVYSHMSHWPNMVFNISKSNFDVALVEDIGDQINDKNIFPLLISTDDKELYRIFRKYKYMPISQWTSMYIDVESYRSSKEIDNSIEVGIIDSSFESLSDWVKLVELNLFDNKHLEQSIFEALIGEKKIAVVYARLNGNLVGTAMIFYDNYQFAGVYMVSTNLEFRGRGIGRRIIEFCLVMSRLKGFHFVFYNRLPTGCLCTKNWDLSLMVN